jgi:hypothetical protein
MAKRSELHPILDGSGDVSDQNADGRDGTAAVA